MKQTGTVKVVTEEKKVTKQVSEVTGEVITVRTGKSSVKPEVTICTKEIVKTIPEVERCTPVTVKTSESGDIAWKTIVYSNQEKSIQVTSMVNKTSNKVTVVDSKIITKTIEAPEIVPEIKKYTIPRLAIKATTRRLSEIKQIVEEVQQTYKKSEIVAIDI